MIKPILIKESFRLAWHAIANNILRTVLSLLGVTIGILAITTVFTIVDSLEKNIRDSVNKLGTDVFYIQKWPWGADEKGEYKWWDFWKRPEVKIDELYKLKEISSKSESLTFQISAERTLKYKSNSIKNVNVIASTNEYDKIRNFELFSGRYFTNEEMISGKNYAIIGYNISEELFGNNNVIGKKINLGGRKVHVIGVFEKEGEDITGNSLDYKVLIPIQFGRNIINIHQANPLIIAKSKKNVNKIDFKNDLKQAMRNIRRLKPKIADNFALNEISVISSALDSLFNIIGLAGLIIGGFSVLVGGFGIANIMFVSVKERTRLIGIQKSLGAKNNFILIQFLLESIILCLIGGLIGLLLVFILTNLINNFFDFTIFLSLKNIALGIIVSVIIGILAGIIPAFSASRLDPVNAMRK